MTARIPAFLVLVVAAFLAGCGGSAASASPESSAPIVPTVTGAWVRPPLGPDRPAGGYLTITGAPGSADALVSASVEIHETTADASGMAAMHPIQRLDIPAGGTVRLEPGGHHLMLMGVSEPLVVGETVEITLTFETAGEVTVQAQIRAS
jgi:copper(I)-binding protein